MSPPTVQAGYRIHEWDTDPRWEEFEVPVPGRGEVRVEVEACGVGLTVLNAIRGDLGSTPELLPRVPGHELVGRVVDLGQGVDATLLSRRVVAYFYLICGACSECLAGREPLCRQMGGFLGVHRDGGYAPHVVLPSANVLPIPDAIDPVSATVVPDAVATPVHVSTRATINAEDRVVVIGAGGGVGIHMIQVARLHSDQVVGLDISDQKLSAVEDHGARAFDSSDFAAVPRLFAGGPPTVIVDLVGSEDAALWSLKTLGPRGRLVVLTTFESRPIPVRHRDLVFPEIQLMGSRYATRSEVLTAADLVATGRIRPVIGEVVESTQLLGLHQRLRTGRLLGRGALKWI